MQKHTDKETLTKLQGQKMKKSLNKFTFDRRGKIVQWHFLWLWHFTLFLYDSFTFSLLLLYCHLTTFFSADVLVTQFLYSTLILVKGLKSANYLSSRCQKLTYFILKICLKRHNAELLFTHSQENLFNSSLHELTFIK